MEERYTDEQIKEFWDAQADEHEGSYAASWSDKYAIELEITKLQELISDGDKILDIGCANGFTTLEFARENDVTIKGLDYSANMIDMANRNLEKMAGSLKGSATFDVGNILSIKEEDAAYDKAVVVRVLINLGNTDAQETGLSEALRVLRPGGRLMLSEATIQGWNKINELRGEWGLTEIPMPPFNTYIDEDWIAEAATRHSGELVEIVNFSSTYFVGTRLLKPIFAKVMGADVDVANPEMEWNRFCSQLPAWGDYGTQKLFIFEKK